MKRVAICLSGLVLSRVSGSGALAVQSVHFPESKGSSRFSILLLTLTISNLSPYRFSTTLSLLSDSNQDYTVQ